MQDIETLRQWIEESKNIVFFGGAGVSTESGIPDFRSQDGLYHQHYDLPPETILSHDYFMSHTQEFYRFYRDKMLCLDAEPNAAHRKLAELEEKRQHAAGVIPQPVFVRYEFIRKRLEHPVIVAVKEGICTGCHIAVPPQSYIELQRGQQILSCPNCQRLIFWNEHFPDMELQAAPAKPKTLVD